MRKNIIYETVGNYNKSIVYQIVNYEEGTSLGMGCKSHKKIVSVYIRRKIGSAEVAQRNVEMQIDKYIESISNNPNWGIDKVYADYGDSVKHSAFNQMIEDARNGEIEAIITKNLSRLSRDAFESIDTIRELKCLGVEVIFEKEGLSSKDANFDIVLNMMQSFREAERECISRQIKSRKFNK